MKPDERRARAVAAARQPISWGQLNAVCRLTVSGDPSIAEWQGRIVDRVLELGYAIPEPGILNRAIARNRHLLPPSPPTSYRATRSAAELAEMTRPDPTKLPRPGGEASLSTAIGRALAKPIANACGCSKPISGRRPLVCTREKGHEGDHGIGLSPGLPLFVRWARDSEAERARADAVSDPPKGDERGEC